MSNYNMVRSKVFPSFRRLPPSIRFQLAVALIGWSHSPCSLNLPFDCLKTFIIRYQGFEFWLDFWAFDLPVCLTFRRKINDL